MNEAKSSGEKPEWTFTSNSLSGNERNRTFLRLADSNFADVTLVSGADDLADGRSYAKLDFDNDGWTDIAMMTLNAPRFKLYRNRMGALYPNRRSIRFRLVGGNTTAEPSDQLSNRDAIGARVLVIFESGKKVMLQRQAGEGFASQNSAVLSAGIPKGDTVKNLQIRWPSGKTSTVSSIDESSIMTIREEN